MRTAARSCAGFISHYTSHIVVVLILSLQWLEQSSLATYVDAIVGSQRSVFKTLAWAVSARVWPTLEVALEAGLQRFGQSEHRRSSVATPARAAYPLLAGCVWCNDYCYDHVIEWLLQARAFMA